MTKKLILILVLLAQATILATPAHAFWGKMLREGSEEVIEYVARKFGIDLGEEAGRRFAQEAGEFLARHGDEGTRLLRAAGPDMLEATAKYSDEVIRMCKPLADDAAHWAARNIDVSIAVFRQYGDDGVAALCRHQGIGSEALDFLGTRGAGMLSELPPVQCQKLVTLSRMATDQAERTLLSETILKYGDDVVEFLWRHKFKIAAGVGVYALVHEYESEMVTLDQDDQETVVRQGSSLLGRMAERSWVELLKTYPEVLLALYVALFIGLLMVLVKLRKVALSLMTLLRKVSGWIRRLFTSHG